MGPISAGGEKNYYLTHREELLKAFHETNNGARQYLAARDGEKLASAVTREAASRFSSLLPQLPDVGGEQTTVAGRSPLDQGVERGSLRNIRFI